MYPPTVVAPRYGRPSWEPGRRPAHVSTTANDARVETGVFDGRSDEQTPIVARDQIPVAEPHERAHRRTRCRDREHLARDGPNPHARRIRHAGQLAGPRAGRVDDDRGARETVRGAQPAHGFA